MLESLRKLIVLPQIPTRVLYPAGVLTAFVWLLVNDQIHPLLVYLLQLYLTF